MLTRMPRLPTHPARPEYFGEDLISQLWAKDDLIQMDAAFIAAMTRNGYAITTPSSRPGTKAPILGYRREDQYRAGRRAALASLLVRFLAR